MEVRRGGRRTRTAHWILLAEPDLDENLFAGVRDLIIEYTGQGEWARLIQIFSVVFLALLLDFIQRRVLARIK